MQNKATKLLPLNKETKILLLNKGMRSKDLKSEKIKKRKKKRAKAVRWLWREGLKEAEGKEKELKEEKEEECKAQVLNGDRESERERERESPVERFFLFCNCVAACGRDKVSDFSIFFCCVQVRPRYIGMKIRIFFLFYLLKVIVKIHVFILKMLNV